MSGSHRTSARGIARRRTTLAAGAVLASAGIAFAPVAGATAATEVDAVQAAENGYTTWQNIIRIAGASSAAQDAVLGVAAKPLPNGWVPTSATTAPPTSVTQLAYLQALGQAATMVVTPADTFQVGDKPAAGGTGGAIGDVIGGFEIPSTLISLDPKLLFGALGITDPTGLGLTDPFGTAGTLLTPLYSGLVTPIATPVAETVADLTAGAVNAGGKHAAEGSGNVAEIIERVSGGVVDAADKIEPVVPEAPPTPLDDVTIEPVTDAVDETLDTVEGAADAPASLQGEAPSPVVASADDADDEPESAPIVDDAPEADTAA